VGTNDLLQYAIAIDRGNPDVAYLYNPMHPAILRMLLHVIEVGRKAGICVSICGEMAGDPAYTLVLLALGSEELEAILGLDRAAIAQKFGTAGDTVIHRDHFVLTPAVADPAQT
jgi:signal transduction protein with GAF and PtsI domain